MIDDHLEVAIKNGNYKRSTGILDEYQISKDQKAYLRFKGIDTLFYVDYSADSTEVTKVSKVEERTIIAGLECKSLVVEAGKKSTRYLYSPSLHQNPDYNRNNRIARYDIFIKETESVWLASEEQTDAYSLSYNCVLLKPAPIHDAVFELPSLPQAKLPLDGFLKEPVFSRQYKLQTRS